MPDTASLLTTLHSIHDCLFFLNSKYYEITNRLSGVRYINVFPSNEAQFNYKLVGYIIILTMAIKSVAFGKSVARQMKVISSPGQLREEESTAEIQGEASEPALDCKICFDARKSVSSTPCGHLFCWDCILRYAQVKYECPICRAPVQPKEIIRIANLI
jgi:peroxin-10